MDIKWKKIRRSKYRFPTIIKKGSGKTKGHLIIGEGKALADVERSIGGKLQFVKTAHTRTQWVWCQAISKPFVKSEAA